MKLILLLSLLLCLLFIGCVNTAEEARGGLVDAQKEITAIGAGVWMVNVSYRLANGVKAKISQVQIHDSLPHTVDLLSGKLVLLGDVPTSAWTSNIYEIKVSPDAELNVSVQAVDVELPAAEISFLRSDSSARDSVRTKPVNFVLTIPVPTGTINSPLLIAFATIAFPIIAAVTLISYFQRTHQKKK